MKIETRNALNSDYESIKKLMIQSQKHHATLRADVYSMSEDFFTEELYSSLLTECNVLVAVNEENRITGVVSYSIKDMKGAIIHPFKSLWISDLVVDENCRNQGIATILMEKVKNIAKEKDVDRIQLSVNALNRGAVSLYEKLGFTPEIIKMEFILHKEE